MLNKLPGHRAGIKGGSQERFALRNLAPEALGSAISSGIGTYPRLPDLKPGKYACVLISWGNNPFPSRLRGWLTWLHYPLSRDEVEHMTRQGRRVTGGQTEPGSWVGKLSLDQQKDLLVEGHLRSLQIRACCPSTCCGSLVSGKQRPLHGFVGHWLLKGIILIKYYKYKVNICPNYMGRFPYILSFKRTHSKTCLTHW